VEGGPNYTLFGGNISQFTGHTVELRIATQQTPANLWYSSSLDDIVFSSTAIPEPQVLALLPLGVLMFWWLRRMPDFLSIKETSLTANPY